MQFNFRDSDYRIKYKARGIAWRGKIGVDVSDCKTTEEAIVKAKLDYIELNVNCLQKCRHMIMVLVVTVLFFLM